MKITEADSVVEELNDHVEDAMEGCSQTFRPFLLTSCGNEMGVTFFGIPIWDSANDEREDEEPLKDYILNSANDILADLRQLGTLTLK